MRFIKAFLVGLMVIIGVTAYAEDSVTPDDTEVATSLKYVTDKLATRQDIVPAQSGTAAVTFTDSAGTITPTTVKTTSELALVAARR